MVNIPQTDINLFFLDQSIEIKLEVSHLSVKKKGAMDANPLQTLESTFLSMAIPRCMRPISTGIYLPGKVYGKIKICSFLFYKVHICLDKGRSQVSYYFEILYIVLFAKEEKFKRFARQYYTTKWKKLPGKNSQFNYQYIYSFWDLIKSHFDKFTWMRKYSKAILCDCF